MPFPISCTATALPPGRPGLPSPQDALERVRDWLIDEGATVGQAAALSLTFDVPFDFPALLGWSHPVLLPFDSGTAVVTELPEGPRVDVHFSMKRWCAIAAVPPAAVGTFFGLHAGFLPGAAFAMAGWLLIYGIHYVVSLVRAVVNLEHAVYAVPAVPETGAA